MTKSHHVISLAAGTALVLVVLLLGTPAARQDSLAGSWEMTGYEGPATVGKGSGQLLFAEDRFAMVYTMDEPSGRKSGRAHAGRYRVAGDELIFDVEWSLEQVSGKGSVAEQPVRAAPRLKRNGDIITLTFENGGIQTFRRAGSVK